MLFSYTKKKKKMKSFHLQQNRWTLRVLYEVKQVRERNTNTIGPLLHEEFEKIYKKLIGTENRLVLARGNK